MHFTLETSYPVLVQDNNVDYVDGDSTFCDKPVGSHWKLCAEDTPITCVTCLAGMFSLEAAAYTYLGSRSGRMSSDS